MALQFHVVQITELADCRLRQVPAQSPSEVSDCCSRPVVGCILSNSCLTSSLYVCWLVVFLCLTVEIRSLSSSPTASLAGFFLCITRNRDKYALFVFWNNTLKEIADRHGRNGCCSVPGAKELHMRNRYMLCGCNSCDVSSTAQNARYNVPHDFLVLQYIIVVFNQISLVCKVYYKYRKQTLLHKYVSLCPSMMGKRGLYPIWAPTNTVDEPSRVHVSV